MKFRSFAILFLIFSCGTLEKYPFQTFKSGKQEFREGWSSCPTQKENETVKTTCSISPFAKVVFYRTIITNPSSGNQCLEECKSISGETGLARLAVENIPSNGSILETEYTFPKVPSKCILRNSPPVQVYRSGVLKVPSSVTKRKEKTKHCTCNLFIEYERGETQFASIFNSCMNQADILKKNQENFYYKYRY